MDLNYRPWKREVQPHLRGGLLALAAAALFGASAPLCKLLLPQSGPLVLSALLYLGAAAGLSLFKLFPGGRRPEAPLCLADLGLLTGIVAFGGIVGPVLMLLGLERVSALAGSLLLNLEAPFTILVAVTLFGEHLGWRETGAALLVVLGGALLGYKSGELGVDWLGWIAIAGACLSWGIDNNLSQRLSIRDPVAVVRIKTCGAGACTFIIALATGHALPQGSLLAMALILGALSYGLSMVLAMRSFRILGAAREVAYFATAPFIGAVLSVPIFGELPSATGLVATGLMATGILLLLREQHYHTHTHEGLEHEHLHVHDEHHSRHHQGPLTQSHSHPHRHETLTHGHPHVSDVHHRHPH